jgi:lipoprotein-anchoring transpeptidase ErfK/SrfK
VTTRTGRGRPSVSSIRMGVRSARRRGRSRVLWGSAAAVALALLGLVTAALLWSGATLVSDAVALARVDVQPLGGMLESARATGPGGQTIPLSVRNGRLTPKGMLAPGERVSVEVVVRRPGWLGWLIGSERRERLSVRAPVAHPQSRWLTVPVGTPVRIGFDQPVTSVVYTGVGASSGRLQGTRRWISLGRRAATGSIEISVSARTWERLGPPVSISWFPASRMPVLISNPPPGARITPITPLRLTFSKPVSDLLGSARPTLTPRPRGHWRQLDSHTLVFVPAAAGIPFASELQLDVGHAVVVRSGDSLRATRRIGWTVPPGSTLRLQQLLAEAGYLPLDWAPAGSPAARTQQDEELAAITPPDGSFHWRYPHVPPELRTLWSVGQTNQIIRGAVMMFEHDHGLAADGLAGANVWAALIADTIAGKRRESGYSYVYVHRGVPQSLNLWHNGKTILTSPGNTGVPAAPTQLGTFPVFEHIPIGTMRGRNPDGSRYNDPGIRYISYFNHGDAIHAFNRASFGTPQSLGCVELPLDAAAQVWPHTPIGTLVTIEN